MRPSLLKQSVVAGCLLVLAATALRAAEPAAGVDAVSVPFIGGQNGYPAYRIPSIVVTRAGTVLAFAEGRANKSDHAENDIVLRRSTDGGKTWGELQVVAEDGPNCLNNPTAVVLRGSGRVLLMYQRYPKGKHEREVKPGVSGDDTCLSFIITSDDDGKTWSKPSDITPQVKRPTVATSLASGPGVGIELTRGKHAGRIVFPFNQGPFGNWQVYAVYSDDGGKSWRFGDLAPAGAAGRGNEVQMVELSDGRVQLNSRGSSGKALRKVAVSADGGQSWSELADEPAMPESRCQASVIRYDEPSLGNQGAILFVNPAVTAGRTKGTVRMSTDDGATWPISREIVPGSFAYSCLAVLPDKSVLCLYETDGYDRIQLCRFTLDWLKDGGHPN